MKHASSLFCGVVISLLTAACQSPVFAPVAAPNPWSDDYMSITGLTNYRQWGTYNVHDPSCRRVGDYYYMYSTDAIYHPHRPTAEEREQNQNIPTGFIQVRRSRDLVNWEFVGWAFPEIPQEAVDWVHAHADGRGASNIWAPYMIPYKDKFRLYYCVSAFGRKTSYMGLAESDSPAGPWTLKGCAVKTDNNSVMNAIDPSVIVDPNTGQWWMIYGSYFGGLFAVELNPETGLPLKEGDPGHVVARRANYRHDNLEAPDILYHPELKKYFLFVSYDPLMTTYNVRVGRSDHIADGFTDFTGLALKDTTNNFPILTAPYRFDHHPGWAGTGHCGVFTDNEGHYFMTHQGRLSPENQQLVLHVRQMFFNADGWPVVSPERYAGTAPRTFRTKDLAGEWEIIRVREPLAERQLDAGQIMPGEAGLKEQECNGSVHHELKNDGSLDGDAGGKWSFDPQQQTLELRMPEGEQITDLIVFAGHDWERETETVLFTGLDAKGRSVWGKRVK
ncbi:MAG: arabinan endo-1,5-alpha-L-arabinosidase [Prevotellaceae bacterium]|nr:arabinan endo-1,5-alpha-L-arabinosidase [Prevotellaceae bacterium]